MSIVNVEVCSAEMTVDRFCGERAYAPHASFSILFYRHLHKNKARFSETQTAHVLFPFADFYIYSVITSSVMNEAPFIKEFVRSRDTCLFRYSSAVFSSAV